MSYQTALDDVMADIQALREAPEHQTQFLLGRIELGIEAIAGLKSPVDRGPWKAVKDDTGLVYVQSATFDHDAILIVNGDFYNEDSKLTYAKAIAKQLGEQPSGMTDKAAAKFAYTQSHKSNPSNKIVLLNSGKDQWVQLNDTEEHALQNLLARFPGEYTLSASSTSGIGINVSVKIGDVIHDITDYNCW